MSGLTETVQAGMAKVLCGERHRSRMDDLGHPCGRCDHLADEVIEMLRESFGLDVETKRQTQTGFGGLLIGSDFRALPQGTYSRLIWSRDWIPTEDVTS